MLFAMACAPLLALVLVPGSERTLTSVLAVLLLPEILCYGIAALTTAILNVHGHFAAPAWAPAVNNLAVCLVVVGYWAVPGPRHPMPDTMSFAQVATIGIGTTAGIAAQATVTVVALRRSGFRWSWRITRGGASGFAGMRGITAWTAGYVVISQVGVVAIQHSGAYSGELTVFTYADLLFQIPFGVLALPYLTAVMPELSRAAAAGHADRVRDHYRSMARVSSGWLVPATCGLTALGPWFGGLLFGTSFFGHSSSTHGGGVLIGEALAASAFGLVPFAIVMIQLRVCYALHDLRTPVLINVVMVGVKVVLVMSPPLVHGMEAEWLNIATSVSYCVGACAGQVVLSRRLARMSNPTVGLTDRLVGR
jgi:putative peptidoglycan lipid II flippase